jgi:hypothetical protein
LNITLINHNPLTMRKLSLIVLICLSNLVVSAQDNGNEPKVYRNSFKINPLSFFSSTFQMSYERLVGEDKSLNFSAGLTYKDSDDESVSGYRGEFQFRYFVLQRETANASRKLYFAPFVFDQYTDVTDRNYYYSYPYAGYDETYKYNVNSFGAGIVMGFNWIFAKRFVLDAFVGGGVRTSNLEKISNYYFDDGLMGYGYKGIFPRVGLDLGFTF